MIDRTSSCKLCVDQLVWDTSSLIERFCDLIGEPQVSHDIEKVGHLKRSDSLSISLVEDPIACLSCLAHTNHAIETSLEDDIHLA